MYSTIWFLFYRIQIKPFLIPLWQSGHHQLFVYWFIAFDLSMATFIHCQDGSTLHISCHRGCALWSNTFPEHFRRVEGDRRWDISDNFEAFHRIYNCLGHACVSLASLNHIENTWRMISQPIDLSKKNTSCHLTIEVIESIFRDAAYEVRPAICSVCLLELDVFDWGLDLPPVS